MGKQPPVGDVTMLFTDIEGSTRLARRAGDLWPEVLGAHHDIVASAIRGAGGHVEGTEGDAFFATFPSATAAISAAISAQRALSAARWPTGVGELRVRMGVHRAHVDRFNDQCVGLEVHRAARVASAAHGGQVILTSTTRAALSGTLTEDLGAHRLKDFPEPTHLFHLVVDGRSAESYPPPATLDVLPTNLPPTPVEPLGRASEIDLVRKAFVERGARVVTLTGLGGIGKTTTALAVAHSLLNEYPGGVWLVRAEALSDGDQLLDAIQDVLWVSAASWSELAQRLAERKVLLVLDNLEQVRGAARVVADLIALAPVVAILATSRAPLGLAGEDVVALGPLPIEAARQVIERGARAVGGPIDLGEAARPALDSLCERLDCLPLALELIAPRLRVFSVEQVLDRLGSVGDITTAAPDRPGRHRSLRATVEWTVALLPPDARKLLIRLTCFHGPAPLDLLEGVCAWDIDGVEALSVLLDYSLVQRRLTGFALVAAVRDVLAPQLAASGEDDTVRLRHAKALAALAEPRRQLAMTADEFRVARELETDGWLAAVWARAHAAPVHRSLVVGLATTWALAGHLDRALDEVRHAMSNESIAPLDMSRLLRVQSYVKVQAGRVEEAIADAKRAVEMAGGESLYDEYHALIVMSQAQNVARLYEASRESARSAVERSRRLGDAPVIVRALVELVQAELAAGDVGAARAALDEAAALVEETTSGALMMMVSAVDADVRLASGDFDAAIEANVRLLESDYEYEAWTVAAVAVAFAGLGEAAEALEVGTVALMMARDRGIDPRALTQVGEEIHAVIERAREMLSPDAAAAAERAGRRLPAGQRVARVCALGRRRLGSQREGRSQRAW